MLLHLLKALVVYIVVCELRRGFALQCFHFLSDSQFKWFLSITLILTFTLPLCAVSSIDPITLSPQRDYLISKSSNNNVTYNCTFLSTTGHDSSSILWKIGNATLLDRDQYVQFGVNALDSSNRIFSQLFFSPAGRAWLFSEIEEMNISVQCLGSERGFVVTETGSISSIVVCGECLLHCPIPVLKCVMMLLLCIIHIYK